MSFFPATVAFAAIVSFPSTQVYGTTTNAVIISGAGESSVNGVWLDSGSFNGHQYYIKLGQGSDLTYWTMKFNSITGWTITADQNINAGSNIGADDLYKSSTIGDGSPDVAPWLVPQWYRVDNVVALPAPTVMQGTYPQFPATSTPSQPLPEYDGITNTQKLLLSPSSPVGTQAIVSDSFYVTGTASDDGFYYPDGGTLNSRVTYTSTSAPSGGQITWDTAKWTNDNGLNMGAGANPWTASIAVVVTYPAIQQLNAPSTAQGGVFVSGGTFDAVFSIRNASPLNGKPSYNILGHIDDSVVFAVSWFNQDPGSESPVYKWAIFAAATAPDTPVYYSLSDTATPDLATNWKNASDDSPAAITVTSVSVGDLAAGVIHAGNTMYRNGGVSFPNYTDVLGVAADFQWDGGASDHAFPWEAGFVRDNVASQSNWGPVSP